MGNYFIKKWYFDTIEPTEEHTHTLIFLHGLGDKGKSFEFYFGNDGCLAFPNLKVLLPTARSNPVSCNNGMCMYSWFDILSLGQK